MGGEGEREGGKDKGREGEKKRDERRRERGREGRNEGREEGRKEGRKEVSTLVSRGGRAKSFDGGRGYGPDESTETCTNARAAGAMVSAAAEDKGEGQRYGARCQQLPAGTGEAWRRPIGGTLQAVTSRFSSND